MLLRVRRASNPDEELLARFGAAAEMDRLGWSDQVKGERSLLKEEYGCRWAGSPSPGRLYESGLKTAPGSMVSAPLVNRERA